MYTCIHVEKVPFFANQTLKVQQQQQQKLKIFSSIVGLVGKTELGKWLVISSLPTYIKIWAHQIQPRLIQTGFITPETILGTLATFWERKQA